MLADPYDAFLFDLDGVLYLSDEPIPGAADALRRLREAGKRLAFVTNNSSRTPEEVSARLRSVGVAADPEEVETSALATATSLAARGVATAYVVGGGGVREALAAAGIALSSGDGASPPDAVVVGWDPDVTYGGLRTASRLIDRGTLFVGTNPDASYPAPGGERWPGAGALIAAVQTATGREPEIIGKPNRPIFDAALARAGGGKPLVIGDRIDTDIEGARRLGWDSALVLSGISTREDLARSGFTATYVLDDLSALVEP